MNNIVIELLIKQIQQWKFFKDDPDQSFDPNIVLNQLRRKEPGMLSIAVSTAVDRGIITQREADEIL